MADEEEALEDLLRERESSLDHPRRRWRPCAARRRLSLALRPLCLLDLVLSVESTAARYLFAHSICPSNHFNISWVLKDGRSLPSRFGGWPGNYPSDNA